VFIDAGGGNGIHNATRNEEFQFVYGDVTRLSTSFLRNVRQFSPALSVQ
jgi:hypothetical protein